MKPLDPSNMIRPEDHQGHVGPASEPVVVPLERPLEHVHTQKWGIQTASDKRITMWRVCRAWLRGQFPREVDPELIPDHSPEAEMIRTLGRQFPVRGTNVPPKTRRWTPHLNPPTLATPAEWDHRPRPLSSDEAQLQQRFVEQSMALHALTVATARNLGIPERQVPGWAELALNWPSREQFQEFDLALIEFLEEQMDLHGKKTKVVRAIASTLKSSLNEATELYREAQSGYALAMGMDDDEVRAMTEQLALQHAQTAENPVPGIAALQRSRGIGKESSGDEDMKSAMQKLLREAQSNGGRVINVDIEPDQQAPDLPPLPPSE